MPRLPRRPQVSLSLGCLGMLMLPACQSQPATQESAELPADWSKPHSGPVLIATWPFGRFATETALEALQGGADRIDAIEAGIREVERRSSDGSVGLGGRPNAAGYPQLDACIMDGVGHRAGSVAGVEGIVHPISAARKVMDHSEHVMLVGEGARWFALEHGLQSQDDPELDAKKQAWVDRERDPDVDRAGHDTIALLMLDADGNLSGGCSTSGAGGKLPGRVGDSPILGSGLYVDNEVGAAGATGLGENIMRYCATFWIVEMMRQGMHPQAACEAVVHGMANLDPHGYELSSCFIAIDKQGRTGAAASNQSFPFWVTTTGASAQQRVAQVAPR